MSADDGLTRLGLILDRLGQRLPVEVDNGVVRLGAATLGQLKLRASGRPGPRRVTGDYTRKMNMQADHSGNGVTVTVGGNGVQGPRLEFGFKGTDSLGRRYNQPPFPHYAPTYLWLNGMVTSEIPGYIGRAVGGVG